jgi:hypothetical protein
MKMKEAKQLQTGDITAVTVLVDGKSVEYKLSLVEIAGKGYTYLFTAEDGSYLRSIYSGGSTGVGVDQFDIIAARPSGGPVIASRNVDEIGQLITKREADNTNAAEVKAANIAKAVEELNSNPIFLTATEDDENYYVVSVGKAVGHNDTVIAHIRKLKISKATGEQSRIDTSPYVRSNGVILKKKAIDAFGAKGPEIVQTMAKEQAAAETAVRDVLVKHSVKQSPFTFK